MSRIGRILNTIRLIRNALQPATNNSGSPEWTAAVAKEPLSSGRGEIGLFFPQTAPLAAPFLLFRLKRLGYSDCRVLSKDDGLYLFARR